MTVHRIISAMEGAAPPSFASRSFSNLQAYQERKTPRDAKVAMQHSTTLVKRVKQRLREFATVPVKNQSKFSHPAPPLKFQLLFQFKGWCDCAGLGSRACRGGEV